MMSFFPEQVRRCTKCPLLLLLLLFLVIAIGNQIGSNCADGETDQNVVDAVCLPPGLCEEVVFKLVNGKVCPCFSSLMSESKSSSCTFDPLVVFSKW